MVVPGIDESYPSTLPSTEVAEYIAQKKAAAYEAFFADGSFQSDDIVLTADTVVILEGEVMGKPHSEEEACQMLRRLSGKTHKVITGVCLLAFGGRKEHFSVTTDVTFANLTDEQIDYYVTHYHPLDKAGAYGIQEWIGYVGVSCLHGSYFNVMGLPVQRISETLLHFQ